MIDKVISLIKSEPFNIPPILIKNYRKLNITDSEFILIIYLINTDSSFNPKLIAKDLNFTLNEVMNLVNSLVEKDILKIDIVNNKVMEEIINLDELYNKISFLVVNGETKKEKTNIFDKFESEFGRTLSPLDYEIISDWQKDFSDEIILLALKEAVFNGVTNLRYIDKIIRDWDKKGIKNEKDVLNDKKKYKEKKQNKLFDYDWLNERDN